MAAIAAAFAQKVVHHVNPFNVQLSNTAFQTFDTQSRAQVCSMVARAEEQRRAAEVENARVDKEIAERKRAAARQAKWREEEAEAAERLRKLEQRTGLQEGQEASEESSDEDGEFDLEKLRRQAKERIASQEGRTAYANREGEKLGVRGLEARLKGGGAAFHPPVGATEWVDEIEEQKDAMRMAARAAKAAKGGEEED